jgi:hypothetical protein
MTARMSKGLLDISGQEAARSSVRGSNYYGQRMSTANFAADSTMDDAAIYELSDGDGDEHVNMPLSASQVVF